MLSLARDRDIELVDLGRGGKLAGHAGREGEAAAEPGEGGLGALLLG